MIPNPIINNRKYIIICVLLLFAAIIILASTLMLSSDTFCKGIYVEGVNLWKMDVKQAEELVKNEMDRKYPYKYITLKYGSQVWRIGLDEIEFKFLVDDAVKQAFEMLKSGNIFKRLSILCSTKEKKADIKAGYSINDEKLHRVLADIKKQVDIEAKNAAVVYQNNVFKVEREIIGRSFDIEENMKIIENRLENRIFDDIELCVKDIIPDVLYENINQISYELASFSTSFDPRDANRTHNIRLACERINNTLLFPGDEFSMDKALGQRNLENGYMEAPVILNNEMVMDAGGGVCQVTTTLYDAVLKAKLKVLERTHHSMPLSYVPPGLDATIAEGYIDFKFSNNRDYAVFINAEVKDASLTVKIFGMKPLNPVTVKLRPEIIAEIVPEGEEIIFDNTVPPGEKVLVRSPRNGLRVVLYRETYDNSGSLLEREKISDDTYYPIKAQYKVNPDTW